MFDARGKSYIDFISGISVSNVGHGNPKVVDAIKKIGNKTGLNSEEMEILIEGNERGRWMGRTRGNKIVFLDDAAQHEDRTGQLVTGRIKVAGPWSLQGEITGVVRQAPAALGVARTDKLRRSTIPLSAAPLSPYA